MPYVMKPKPAYKKEYLCTAPYHKATKCEDFRFGYCQNLEKCINKSFIGLKEDV